MLNLSLKAEQNKDTVEALLMETLVGGQLYSWPPSQNPPSTPLQTWFLYSHKGTILIGG